MGEKKRVYVGKWYIVDSDPLLGSPFILDGPYNDKNEALEWINWFPYGSLIRQWNGKKWVA